MTDLYHLFQDLEIAEMFEEHFPDPDIRDEINRIKSEISKRGNFQRLRFNHVKIADEVYELQRAYDDEITTYVDGVKTVLNYLEYQFRKGKVKRDNPFLKYIIRK
jgi:phosphoglycolate phosphatase-like HAD superfamily hydrolase